MLNYNYAIIVTFNPNISSVVNLVDRLLLDGFSILIIDNNSKDFNLNINNVNLKIFKLRSNKGIAFAQNFGIQKAKEFEAHNIIFFDQDSKIDNNFIQNLILDYEKIKSSDEKIAAIGPRFIDENKGFYFPALKFNSLGLIDKIPVENIEQPCEVSFLISSGTLVSMKALEEIGLMKEEYFIDFVDTEWCFRALSKGYKLYMSEKAVMKHSIGEDTLKILKFNIPVHSGYRRYYRIRNLFFMWKMPYIPKILVAKLMLTNFAIQILLFLLKDKKLDYIKYYIKAIRDGIKQSRDYPS